jgi:protein phosphatase
MIPPDAAARALTRALAAASDPQTAQPRLRELATSTDAEVVARVASNPNTPLDLLVQLLPSCPDAILQNPALALLELEGPGSLNSLPAGALLGLLARPLIPTWLATQLLGSPPLGGDQRFELACSPTTPPAVLLALALSGDDEERRAVGRHPALPAEGVARLASDPRPEVRAAVAGGACDLATLRRLAADPHPAPRALARSRLDARPGGPPARGDLDAAGATSTGRNRNEDRFFAGPMAGGYLALVVDGMGGQGSGEEAARWVIREIPLVLAMILPFASIDEEAGCLETAIEAANKTLIWRQRGPGPRGMGATMAAALFCEDRVHLAHVGDSRIHRLRQGLLEPLTRDHSLVNDSMDAMPGLTAEQIAALPRNVVTRMVGMKEEGVAVARQSLGVERGDVYLLSTDGVHESLSPEQMAGVLVRMVGGASGAACALVDTADAGPGRDDCTAIVVDTRSPGANS